MDPRQRRQRLLLGGLLAVLAVIFAFQFWPGSGATTAPAQARPGRTAAAPSRNAKPDAPMSLEVVNVEIGRLQGVPPVPDRTGRNPFRYQARAAVAPVASQRPAVRPPSPTGAAGDNGMGTAPPPPPPPPPINLKYVGLLTAEKGVGRVAVLSDGKYVYYGREGDVIEGRYRVIKIGEESIQMEHVDGRGRQTIRLSGA